LYFLLVAQPQCGLPAEEENYADQQEAGATRNKKGYIDLTTQKSGSIFTTRVLRELSDQYLDLQKKYETLQNSLVKKVVEIAGMSLLSIDPYPPFRREDAG
jgi:DNA mismatch repair ATPase MutS